MSKFTEYDMIIVQNAIAHNLGYRLAEAVQNLLDEWLELKKSKDDYHELLPGDSQEEIIRKLNGSPKEDKPLSSSCWCGHPREVHGPKEFISTHGTKFLRKDACLVCTNCDEFEFEIFHQEKLR